MTNKTKGTHCISLFINKYTTLYFDTFGTEYIPQGVLAKSKINLSCTTYLEYKIMILNMREFYCIAFMKYMIAGTFF